MRHYFQIIVLALMLITSAQAAFASSTSDNEEVKAETYQPIVVRKEPTNFHRSLEAPVFTYYAAGTINLDFVENLGAATVAVQNLTAGGQVVELIDTSMGNVVIEINSILTVGDYYMTITTMSGEVYYAEFTLE